MKRLSILVIALLSVCTNVVSQQPHRQEVSANFGLKGIQSDTENPHSRTATLYPQRVEPTVMASRLEQVADNKWTLKDGWILLENDAVVASDVSIFSDEFSPEDWYNAVVPGTVLTSLVEQGVYPDPYFGVNNMAIPEGLCRKEWWYRTMLNLDQEMLDKRVIQLLFNGINYRADVWLNGVKLGTVNGAFCRGLFDIKEVARKDNILAVHIYPPFNPGFPHEQSAVSGRGPNGGQLCLDGPTFISSEGWDWMPGVRDRNIGIWQDVLLQVNDGISINDTHVITDLPLPSVDYADLIVETELQNRLTSHQAVSLKMTVAGVKIEKNLVLPPGVTTLRLTPQEFPQLRINNPELWWPNGYGEQSLYLLHLEVKMLGGVSDQKDVRFGVRELSYELTIDTPTKQAARIEFNPTDMRGTTYIFNNRMLRDVGDAVSIPSLRADVDESQLHFITDDGMAPYLVIRVNGKRIYCKGGNWGMDDMMKRSTRQRLEPYLKLHKEAGFNMVRNWTGENTEEVFYDLCDEYGMLVWNDFWMSTEGYNLEPNDEELFMYCATDVVRRFRNHPSIAVWCPRNEGYAPETLERGLAEMICQEDGTRHYHPNSRHCNLRPSGPWHYFEDASRYFSREAKGFNTELGSPSVPTARSMRKFLAPEDQWPIGDAWHYHDLHPETKGYMNAVTDLYGEATSLDDFCKKAQLINYNSYRAMFEAWNSRLWKNTSGMLLWMSHPAWPSVEWQSYSWDYETFGSWFGCKKACEPLHIQMNLDDDMLCVVNNTANDERNLKAAVNCYSLDGILLYSQSESIAIAPANHATPVSKAHIPTLEGIYIARVTLMRSGDIVSENDYIRKGTATDFTLLNTLDSVNLKLTDLKIGRTVDGLRTATFTVSNKGKCTAVSVKLNLNDSTDGSQILPAYFSDGYFNLLPGQKRQISVQYSDEGKDIIISAEGYNVNEKLITR